MFDVIIEYKLWNCFENLEGVILKPEQEYKQWISLCH